MQNSGICRLYDVWNELPAKKPRQALDPLRLGADLLPHLALLKVIPGDFRFDLVGQRAQELLGGPAPGSNVAGRSSLRTCLSDLLGSAARSGRPAAQSSDLRGDPDIPGRCFGLVLPLGTVGADVSDLLLGVWPLTGPGQRSGTADAQLIHDVPEFIEGLRRAHRAEPALVVRRYGNTAESIASH